MRFGDTERQDCLAKQNCRRKVIMDWATYAASLQVTDNDNVIIGNGGNGGAGGAGGNGGNGGNGGTFNGNVTVDTGNHFDLGDYFHPVHVEACLPPAPPPPPAFDLTLTDNDVVAIGNGGTGGNGGEHGNGGNGGNGGTFNGDITVTTGNDFHLPDYHAFMA
jgi:hypothetical protein